ncbi:TPA: hypothetical protein ACW3YH_004724 [Salmonella enterica subsp. enterica serovar Thompson]
MMKQGRVMPAIRRLAISAAVILLCGCVAPAGTESPAEMAREQQAALQALKKALPQQAGEMTITDASVKDGAIIYFYQVNRVPADMISGKETRRAITGPLMQAWCSGDPAMANTRRAFPGGAVHAFFSGETFITSYRLTLKDCGQPEPLPDTQAPCLSCTALSQCINQHRPADFTVFSDREELVSEVMSSCSREISGFRQSLVSAVAGSGVPHHKTEKLKQVFDDGIREHVRDQIMTQDARSLRND